MKPQYFHVDVGFFPTNVKLCFTTRAFYKILVDHNIPMLEDPKPLSMGSAETHCFDHTKETVVVMVFSLAECGDDPVYLAGIVAHECNHAVERIMEHIGEKKEEMGEETRSYLLQHIMQQVFKACSLEIAKNARRKESRTAAREKGKRARGSVPKVGGAGDDGRARQVSLFEGTSPLSGVEGPAWSIITPTKANDQGAVGAGHNGVGSVLG
jgi:hypothetical protein